MAREKNPGMFQKGKSGNPGGRAKKTEEERTLEAMCRERTTEALATILEIMANGDNERNKLSAAQYVIDRGWGKAAQAIEHSGKGGEPVQLNMVVEFVKPKKNG